MRNAIHVSSRISIHKGQFVVQCKLLMCSAWHKLNTQRVVHCTALCAHALPSPPTSSSYINPNTRWSCWMPHVCNGPCTRPTEYNPSNKRETRRRRGAAAASPASGQRAQHTQHHAATTAHLHPKQRCMQRSSIILYLSRAHNTALLRHFATTAVLYVLQVTNTCWQVAQPSGKHGARQHESVTPLLAPNAATAGHTLS